MAAVFSTTWAVPSYLQVSGTGAFAILIPGISLYYNSPSWCYGKGCLRGVQLLPPFGPLQHPVKGANCIEG
eukprot:1320811-Amphidinium_carterae.1